MSRTEMTAGPEPARQDARRPAIIPFDTQAGNFWDKIVSSISMQNARARLLAGLRKASVADRFEENRLLKSYGREII